MVKCQDCHELTRTHLPDTVTRPSGSRRTPSLDAIAHLRVPNLEFLRRALGLDDDIPPAFRRAFEGDY
jgi:hypothetical protein